MIPDDREVVPAPTAYEVMAHSIDLSTVATGDVVALPPGWYPVAGLHWEEKELRLLLVREAPA